MRKDWCFQYGVHTARVWGLFLCFGCEDLGLAIILFFTKMECFHNLLKKGEYKKRHVQKHVSNAILKAGVKL